MIRSGRESTPSILRQYANKTPVTFCLYLRGAAAAAMDETGEACFVRHGQQAGKGGEQMTKRETYEARTEEFLLPLMEENHFELVDVEYVKEGGSWYLRAYIDKEGGINIDDCEAVSRRLSDWLDKEDFIDDSYILEVSSPGLGRPLKKEKDFIRSMGKDIEVRLFRAVDKQKEFAGTLTAYDKNTVTIQTENGQTITFDRPNIALIRLAFDF